MRAGLMWPGHECQVANACEGPRRDSPASGAMAHPPPSPGRDPSGETRPGPRNTRTARESGSRGRARKREEEGSALVHGAFRPDAPAVALDDALHGREADARALEVAAGMKPLERLEESLRLRGVEPPPR